MPSHVMITLYLIIRLRYCFFFSSRRRHTRFDCDWSSDVCSSDLGGNGRAMVWPDGKPEKRSAGKERRRTSRLFSEGLQLRNRTGSMRQQTKEYPARGKDSGDRKSTRLNSSHSQISYAVFCLKKTTV